jgi:hypothetical protein
MLKSKAKKFFFKPQLISESPEIKLKTFELLYKKYSRQSKLSNHPAVGVKLISLFLNLRINQPHVSYLLSSSVGCF